MSEALNMAGDFIETYLDRVIAKRPVDEYFPHHFGTVELHNMPVDTAEPVNVFLDGIQQGDYSVWLRRGKTAFLSKSGIRQDMPMDWRGFNQVTVTYTAGFDPIPSDLANAIIWTAALIFQSQGQGTIPGGGGGSGEVKSMTIYDVGSISYDVGSSASSGGSVDSFSAAGIIPDTAAQVLSRYKRLSA